MEAAEQTKNFLSFIFRLSAGGEGGAAKKWKEIFGFARDRRERTRRADWSVRFNSEPPRAPRVQSRFAQMIVLEH